MDTIVVAGPERVGALPSIPNEPRWNYMTTWGVMAPPVPLLTVCFFTDAALNKAAAAPAVGDMVTKNGLVQLKQTPAEAKAFVAAAVKKFSK